MTLWTEERDQSTIPGGLLEYIRREVPEELQGRFTVHPETECWEWNGCRQKKAGYAVIFSAERRAATVAHRVYYERMVGPVPAGLDLDHLCRNRACVNPAHLEPVTRAENILRGKRTKLTTQQVREIRASSEGSTALARRYGVSRTWVQQLRRKHLQKRKDAA